jgi:hypothetical protein
MKSFLLQLSQDYGLQRHYAQDPERVMAEHKLTEAEKAILRAGDEAAVHAYLDGDATVAKVVFVFEPDAEPANTARLIAA